MLKHFIVSGVLCIMLVTSVVSDEPKKSDKRVVPITKEKLLGKWEGPKSLPMTLEFKEKKVTVTVVTKKGEISKSTALEWDYAIDDDGEWVTLQPLKVIDGGLGSAKLNSDGTLSAYFVPDAPPIPKALKDVIFRKVKTKDHKK